MTEMFKLIFVVVAITASAALAAAQSSIVEGRVKIDVESQPEKQRDKERKTVIHKFLTSPEKTYGSHSHFKKSRRCRVPE